MASSEEVLTDAACNAIQNCNVLEKPAEESFGRISRLAQCALQIPLVSIYLAGGDSARAKKQHAGLCADVPLRMNNGIEIGTLSAVDHKSRALTADQVRMLHDLARLVVDEIELRQIATTDSLTGALTRRGFEIEINRETQRSLRYHRGLTLVAVDVDHFKKVNDNYGHAAGDLVLQAVASQIKKELRAIDFLGRLGGEEFAIGLPETDVDGAMIVAERIRHRIAETVVQSDGDNIQVTASFGIADVNRADKDWKVTLGKADVALYQAKERGRNQCVRHEAEAELF